MGYFIKIVITRYNENNGYLKLYNAGIAQHLLPLKNYPDADCLKPLEKTASEKI